MLCKIPFARNCEMRRINPTDLWQQVLSAIFRAQRTVGYPLRRADRLIVDAVARLVFAEMMDGDRVIIEPDRVPLASARGNPLAFSHDRPGKWGEDEPMPAFSNDPPDPPERSRNG